MSMSKASSHVMFLKRTRAILVHSFHVVDLGSTHALQLSTVFGFKPGSSIYSRVETLMTSENGLIGLAWCCLREAWFGPHADKLIVINYDSLTGAR
jgi:hypothetical protein